MSETSAKTVGFKLTVFNEYLFTWPISARAFFHNVKQHLYGIVKLISYQSSMYTSMYTVVANDS